MLPFWAPAMASLRNIINVDDEHADSHSLKKPKESVLGLAHHPESPSYAISSSSATAPPQSSSSSSPLPAHPAPVEAPTSPFSRAHASDAMDSSYVRSYAQTYTQYPAAPARPLAAAADATVKRTPITGRVSRAKKGLAVHVCDLCRPPKVVMLAPAAPSAVN